MNTILGDQVTSLIGAVHQDVAMALLVGFTPAPIVFVLAGIFIQHRRHQFFDLDVEHDVPLVRRNKEEDIILGWRGLTLMLLLSLYQM